MRPTARAVVLATAAAAAACTAACHPRTWIGTRDPPGEEKLRALAETLHAEYEEVRDDLSLALATALRAACPGPEPRTLVLAIDVTSSMTKHLEEVKRAAPLLVEAASHGCRTAIFAYRDRGDAESLVRIADFADPADTAILALNALSASGGGDWAEPVWFVLDAATSTALEPGLPARVILIADAGAHPDEASAARVRERLAAGRVTLSIIDVRRARHTPAPEPVRELPPPALARFFGARFVAVAPHEAGTALDDELAEVPPEPPPEVAIVVATDPMGGAIRSLAGAAGAIRRLEEAGGAVAIVAYGTFADGHPTMVLAGLGKRGAAADVVEVRGAIVGAGEPPVSAVGPLEGLRAAAGLSWTPGRPHTILLLTDSGTDHDPALEDAVRAFLSAGGSSLLVLGVAERVRRRE